MAVLTITLLIKNIFGKTISDVNIELVKIDDYFYIKPKKFEGKTNKEGELTFKSVSDGCYLVKISKRKAHIERIENFSKSNKFLIKVPIFFGWFKQKKLIPESELDRLYEENRNDKIKCFICNKEYKVFIDKFHCKYCKKYFCPKHRLPEEHNCMGNPKAPPGGFREIYTKGGIIVSGK